jgi:hypothetical protein
LNLAGERGPSTFDQRHNLQATFAYSTGVGVRGGALLSGWRGLIIKGWTLSSTITAGSGSPFTPLLNATLPGPGVGGVLRPEYLGGDPYASGVPGRFLNAAAYGLPPAGQFGNAGRDSLYGPNQFAMIGSAARSFADHITATFNASNILNHPTFGAWSHTWDPTGGLFGVRGGPGAMRSITATLRWSF